MSDNTVTCGDCGGFVAVQDAEGLWKAALANHRRFCLAQRQKPASSLQQIPRPITTTTKEKEPMETPTMPAPEVLVDHDSRRVAKAAERVLAAQEALREAWEADAGKAALRAKRDRLKAQLAAVEAEIKGVDPSPTFYRAVRVWAVDQGLEVPRTGRVSKEIVAAYDAAMRGGVA